MDARRRTAARSTLTTVVACVALSVAAPVVADSQSHWDPRGDVTDEWANPGPPRAGIDVLRSRNVYRHDRLRLSMTTADLPNRRWGAYWTIRTGPRTGFALYVLRGPRRSWVYYDDTLIGPPGGRVDRRPPPSTCRGARGAVAGDTVTASVPRRCFDDARRVRVAGAMQDNARGLFDDSRRAGVDLSEPNDEFGPFLHRG